MDHLRTWAFTVVFYLWSALCSVVCTPILFGPRRWTMLMLKNWAKGVIWLLRVVGGVKTEFRGLEHVPTGGAMIGAKHQCMFDTFAPWSVIPDGAFVMKKELLVIPWFGWYCLKAGCIVIDRGAHSAALKKLVRDAKERAQAGRQVIIFPEGTRTKPGAAGDYKPGVAAIYGMAGVPCTPMATNSGVHWPKPGQVRPKGTVVFEFFPAIPPGLKRPEFMGQLEKTIETASLGYIEQGL